MRQVLIILAAVLALVAGPAQAAKEWGIDGEEVAQFEAKAVDVLCELTGDCPKNCGAGKRQMGLLSDDGTLRLAIKSNTLFAGAVLDLLAWCGKRVEVDGLLIKADPMTFYMVQRLRAPGAKKWTNARAFSKAWATENKQKNASRWFRKDPAIKALIKEFGPVGIPGATIPKD
ncbi:MAG: hypothetical protein O3B74_10005 [Proteobacteria bacterium]|nr:hypothetical protein [Pseudomonadota bacterium]MDA1310127.1 hypothetical protein [Pseudomonadota bacterium]